MSNPVKQRVQGFWDNHDLLRINTRFKKLEAEAQEARQLNRRVAELTDLVTELLIPIMENDRAKVDELLERYRSSL